MKPSVLLLDCPDTLALRLSRLGFEVDVGTVGFCDGIRKLPCQVYEKDIFVYDPHIVERGIIHATQNITDATPHFPLRMLDSHLERDVTMLVFVNDLPGTPSEIRDVYSWIIDFPLPNQTADTRVEVGRRMKGHWFAPIADPSRLKLPVRFKLGRTSGAATVLFHNRNDEILGASFKLGQGRVMVLPEFASNEEVAMDFFLYVVPKLHPVESEKGLVARFVSQEEREAQDTLTAVERERVETEARFEAAAASVYGAKSKKIQAIEGDEAAAQLLAYYDTAIRHQEHALYHLDKLTEYLQKRMGGEAAAKELLNCHMQWNLIGRLANATYLEAGRHAPGPGEKVREVTPAELTECFEAADYIVLKYFETICKKE